MKLKNFSRNTIRIVSRIGGHVAIVLSGETRVLPPHMEDAGIRAGLVPLDDVQSEADHIAALEAEAKENAELAAKAEQTAAEERAHALDEAAKKAKASEAAKKAAATRAANKANEAQ